MAISKVVYGSRTLIDLTEDTVAADKLLSGYTAHTSAGVKVTGTASAGTDTSDATASASDILSTKTAYVNGSKVTGTMTNRGAVSQTIAPGGSYTIPQGYHNGSGTVSASSQSLQTKTATVTPGANWSGTNTNNASITPDSGYAGMSQVNVNVPMLRDGTLMVADSVATPSTVYNGDTSQSNSQQLLRMAPSKDGMSYTASYLYMQPNNYLGNATAADVAAGKTFSSSNGIQIVGTKTDTKTMTVVLDLSNSNPATWATYADDAEGMTAGSDAWDEFFGHYPCILDNGVELGKLKRSNFAQYEDGTSAPITTLGKDVMICFPRRGIKIEYLDANTLSVSMTDEDNKTGYSYMAHSYKGNVCDKFYLGAYKGYVSSNKLYSSSGKTPTASQTIGDIRTWAQARGTGYEQSAFYQLTFRQVMYLLKYKGANAQIVIGKGFTDSSNTGTHITGGTNTSGMDYGENTGKYQCKLFGLEDFWGNILEFIDGLYANTNRQLLVSDGNYNNTGRGYTYISQLTSSSNISKYLRYPIGTNDGGFAFFVNSSDDVGSDSTYFCDRVDLVIGNNNGRMAEFGGRWQNGSLAGPFRLDISVLETDNYNYFGSRLMYMHTAS